MDAMLGALIEAERAADEAFEVVEIPDPVEVRDADSARILVYADGSSATYRADGRLV